MKLVRLIELCLKEIHSKILRKQTLIRYLSYENWKKEMLYRTAFQLCL
jgi:hypothetical protein